jgi:hypothetical protein
LDEQTFEALARLEGRVEALRLAYLSLVVILTYHDRKLEQEIETGLFGSFVEMSDKNPHLAMQEELTALLNEITALREGRDETKSRTA